MDQAGYPLFERKRDRHPPRWVPPVRPLLCQGAFQSGSECSIQQIVCVSCILRMDCFRKTCVLVRSNLAEMLFSARPPFHELKKPEEKLLRQSGGPTGGGIHDFASPPHDGFALFGEMAFYP